jgi:hypothetical protein
MENLQRDLNRLGSGVFENEMIINPTKIKAICFTKGRAMEPINYSLPHIVIPVASSCKYFSIILRRNLS